MNTNAHFKVDPRLASLLGENYRSTELAIKELIDNAFDADASNVWIQLPQPLTLDPIVITDDGTGMTEAEVRHEYLNIASSRVSRKGERTRLKNRLVKGRKGIGKFAGLMVASLMEIHTVARERETRLRIFRDELIRAKNDLVQIDLPLVCEQCPGTPSGTEIILKGINQNFTFPNADKLKRLLVLEYGRQPGFNIYVDGELVDIEDIPGESFEHELQLRNGEKAQLRFTLSDGIKPLKQSGIALRVGGKIVGNPRYFGLEEHEEIPTKMLRRLYGELSADSLEQDVTADWGSVVDNSIILQEIEEQVRPLLEEACMELLQREMKWARARLKKRINGSFDRLPPHKKAHASKFFDKVLKKFYGESESRIANIVSVVLDAMEQNDYWLVMQHMAESRGQESAQVADAFSHFGLIDTALIAQQSAQRLAVLKDLEALIFHPDTTPAEIQKAMANNLWLMGPHYAMLAANPELQEVMNLYLNHKYSNGQAARRPNLLLTQDFNKRFLLIELKQPDHTLTLKDRRQAKTYIQDLNVYLPERQIDVVILGGALSSQLVGQRANTDVKMLSYKAMISEARVQLNWLIGELKKR